MTTTQNSAKTCYEMEHEEARKYDGLMGYGILDLKTVHTRDSSYQLTAYQDALIKQLEVGNLASGSISAAKIDNRGVTAQQAYDRSIASMYYVLSKKEVEEDGYRELLAAGLQPGKSSFHSKWMLQNEESEKSLISKRRSLADLYSMGASIRDEVLKTNLCKEIYEPERSEAALGLDLLRAAKFKEDIKAAISKALVGIYSAYFDTPVHLKSADSRLQRLQIRLGLDAGLKGAHAWYLENSPGTFRKPLVKPKIRMALPF